MISSETNFRESPKQAKGTSQKPREFKPEEFAFEFWKRLVAKVGKPRAKEIMRYVMGARKPGPGRSDEDAALSGFIYAYIRRLGLNQSDEKIAKYIVESKPYYIQLESGAFSVVNDEFTEAEMGFEDDPIVGRKPIQKSVAAFEKQVARIRRWTIEENVLPREYAPRPYRRD